MKSQNPHSGRLQIWDRFGLKTADNAYWQATSAVIPAPDRHHQPLITDAVLDQRRRRHSLDKVSGDLVRKLP